MNDFVIALKEAKMHLRVYVNAISTKTGISRVSEENIINGKVSNPRRETAKMLAMCFCDELEAEIERKRNEIEELQRLRRNVLNSYMDIYG